jgi:hypothetical protein
MKPKKVDEAVASRLMLGYLCTATEAEASLVRKVQILDKFDFSNREISIICGATEQSIRNARSIAKREERKKKRKRTKRTKRTKRAK